MSKAPGKRPAIPVKRKKKSQKAWNGREFRQSLLIIFLLSFFISTALIIYVFGMTPDFFSRLFWCLLVVFLLLALTAQGIIPLVNRLMGKWR